MKFGEIEIGIFPQFFFCRAWAIVRKGVLEEDIGRPWHQWSQVACLHTRFMGLPSSEKHILDQNTLITSSLAHRNALWLDNPFFSTMCKFIRRHPHVYLFTSNPWCRTTGDAWWLPLRRFSRLSFFDRHSPWSPPPSPPSAWSSQVWLGRPSLFHNATSDRKTAVVSVHPGDTRRPMAR